MIGMRDRSKGVTVIKRIKTDKSDKTNVIVLSILILLITVTLFLAISASFIRSVQNPWSARNAVTLFFTNVTAIGLPIFANTTIRLP
jgi:hypothetical protein